MSDRFSRHYGSEDMDLHDKLKVKHILLKHGFTRIAFNFFLLTPLDIEDHRYVLTDTVSKTLTTEWKLRARPDVIGFSIAGQPIIIEIDGAVHRGNLDSRPIYDELQIPYIIINKEYMRLNNLSWDYYISQKLSI